MIDRNPENRAATSGELGQGRRLTWAGRVLGLLGFNKPGITAGNEPVDADKVREYTDLSGREARVADLARQAVVPNLGVSSFSPDQPSIVRGVVSVDADSVRESPWRISYESLRRRHVMLQVHDPKGGDHPEASIHTLAERGGGFHYANKGPLPDDRLERLEADLVRHLDSQQETQQT